MFGKRRLKEGDKIILRDGREAEFRFWALSPYVAEERAGVYRAYVWGEGWTDYVQLPEIKQLVWREQEGQS